MANKKNEESAIHDIDWSGADEMVTAESLGDGESVEGFYLGSRATMMPKGPALIHHFRKLDGSRRAVIGTTLLNSQLGGVNLGKLVQAMRVGKLPGKNTVAYTVKVHPTMESRDTDDFVGRADI